MSIRAVFRAAERCQLRRLVDSELLPSRILTRAAGPDRAGLGVACERKNARQEIGGLRARGTSTGQPEQRPRESRGDAPAAVHVGTRVASRNHLKIAGSRGVNTANIVAVGSGREIGLGPRVFSGHESCACRYGWLPKLYEAVVEDPTLFSSDDAAILRLGLGRNMVKSLRFWGEAFRLTRTSNREVHVTEFARMLLDPDGGLDPYLETPGALWRLHWMLTAHAGLGAWTIAFLETYDREISRERFVASVMARASQVRGGITFGTATNHVSVFLRTYAVGRYLESSPEEVLGSPFQELELLHETLPAGVPTVRFLRGPKQTLDVRTLAFVLHDFWQRTAQGDATMSLRSLMLSRGAPGAVLMLDESSLYEKLDDLCSQSRRLVLRSDGAGGYYVACESDPLLQLRERAWT